MMDKEQRIFMDSSEPTPLSAEDLRKAKVTKFNKNHDKLGRFANAFGHRDYTGQTETREFNKWFGGSKVVDHNGRPLIVYHGTAQDVSVFDLFSGSRTPMSAEEGGFFFATTPALASEFARLAGEAVGNHSNGYQTVGGDFDLWSPEPKDSDYTPPTGANVMPVYLSIKKPLTVEAYQVMKVRDDGWMDDDPRRMRQVIQRAKDKGHDGLHIIRYPEMIGNKIYPEDQWVAFEPEQIKSAIGNKGTFDRKNPRITKFDNVLKFNKNHAPAGTPQGGQFISAGGTHGSNEQEGAAGATAHAGADGQGNAGAVPVYGTPRAGAVAVSAVHYSTQPRPVLSSEYAGTGLKGAESKRLSDPNIDPRLRQRLNFYVDEGNGVFPESGVGSYPHKVTLANLYDPDTDKGALWMSGGSLNGSESAILDAGYDGYYGRGVFGRQGVAVLLGPHSVPVSTPTKKYASILNLSSK